MDINIINYKNNDQEEKAIEYIGIIVPSVPYVIGMLSLRSFLKNKENFNSFFCSDDSSNLMAALIEKAAASNKNCDIHIFPTSQKALQLNKDEMHALLTKMLENHHVENVRVLTVFKNIGLFQNKDKTPGKSETIQVAKSQP